jgi:hypothetical protein
MAIFATGFGGLGRAARAINGKQRAAEWRPFCLLGQLEVDLISTEADRASLYAQRPVAKCCKTGTITRPGTNGDCAMTPIEYLAVSCLVILVLWAFAAATAA